MTEETVNHINLWTHFWFRGIIYILILLVVLLTIGYCRMEKILLPGRYTGKCTGNLILSSENARLDAFWHRGLPEMPVILFNHGNGEYLLLLKTLLKEFIDRKYSILAYDYAGYGGSTGNANERQTYLDADTAYHFLTKQLRIPASRIIIFGYSVGSGPSCYLAEKNPVRGLLLCAPFASATQVLFPFSLPRDRFANAERIRKYSGKLLIFHGKKDSVIPYRNSIKIYNAAKGRKKIIIEEDADHNDLIFRLGNRFWEELAFLTEDTETDSE